MEIEVLWMNDYLMVMYEVEKARRARQAQQGHQKEAPSPTGSPPPATGKCLRKRGPKR
jgi:hypothetical protein